MPGLVVMVLCQPSLALTSPEQVVAVEEQVAEELLLEEPAAVVLAGQVQVQLLERQTQAVAAAVDMA